MSGIPRRSALRLLSGAPLAVGFGLTLSELQLAQAHAAAAVKAAAKGAAYKPRFFTSHEWETVRQLVDVILPRDERSGSATDAGVPEFIDFLMMDPAEDDRSRESRQTAMRGGLAWIDAECREGCGKDFLSADEASRRALLDRIAFVRDEDDDEPDPRAERTVVLRHGPAFFSSFRDLTASGFWSSRMGVQDLGYIGNTATLWQGPPPEILRKLGLEE